MSLPPPAVPPSSTARTVTVACPLASAAGVKVSARRRDRGCALNSAVLSLLTLKVTDWPPSPAPAEMPVAQPLTVCGAAVDQDSWSAPAVNDGASLTAATVIVKRLRRAGVDAAAARCRRRPGPGPSPSPSPLAFAAGVKVRAPSGCTAGLAAEQGQGCRCYAERDRLAALVAGPAEMPVAQPATVCGAGVLEHATGPPRR